MLLSESCPESLAVDDGCCWRKIVFLAGKYAEEEVPLAFFGDKRDEEEELFLPPVSLSSGVEEEERRRPLFRLSESEPRVSFEVASVVDVVVASADDLV